jgi:hypothetical protein
MAVLPLGDTVKKADDTGRPGTSAPKSAALETESFFLSSFQFFSFTAYSLTCTLFSFDLLLPLLYFFCPFFLFSIPQIMG